jgi:hypothetical protein
MDGPRDEPEPNGEAHQGGWICPPWRGERGRPAGRVRDNGPRRATQTARNESNDGPDEEMVGRRPKPWTATGVGPAAGRSAEADRP